MEHVRLWLQAPERVLISQDSTFTEKVFGRIFCEIFIGFVKMRLVVIIEFMRQFREISVRIFKQLLIDGFSEKNNLMEFFYRNP